MINLWRKPSNYPIEVIEPTEKASKEYGHMAGFALMKLTSEHIDELKNGKMLAWNDGEYSTFLILGLE